MRQAVLAGAMAGLAAAGLPAAAQEIGRAAAVVPQAQGTPPQGEARVLQIGVDMVRNERVETGPDGRAQLLFVDGTALTVGPNSDLVLDEYVYDPAAGAGTIALSATRGVFRIVGGKVSKLNPVTLRTPTVTIGVRGGVAFANVGETVSAAFIYGEEMTATGGGRTERTVRPGTEIVTPPSGLPNPAQPLTQTTISGSLDAMEGAPGAGAGPAVSDEDVAQSQVAELSSATQPVAVGPGGEAPPPSAAAVEEAADTAIAQQIAMVQEASGGTSTSPTTSTPSTPSPGPLVGRFKLAASPGVDVGTADRMAAFNLAFTGGSIASGVFQATTGASTLTFPLVPDAAGMFSFSSAGTGSAYGPISGSGWVTNARDYGFVEFVESTVGRRGIAFFGTPTPVASLPTGLTSYTLRDDFVLGGSKIPFIPAGLNGDLGGGGKLHVDWAPSASAPTPFIGGALQITGQGGSQRWAASLLVGEVVRDEPTAPFFEGAMRGATRRSASQALSVFFDGAVASSDAGDGSDLFGSQADFVLEALLVDGADVPVDPLTQSGVRVLENGVNTGSVFPNAISRRTTPAAAPPRVSRTMFLETAGIVQDVLSGPTVTHRRFGTNEATPGMIVLDAGAATVGGFASLFSLDGGFGTSTFVRFGEPTNVAEESAFVTDKLWGATESSSASQDSGVNASFTGAIVSSGLVSLSGVLPSGVSLCGCAFVDWGFWSGQLAGSGVRHEFALIPFTAGQAVSAGQFPISTSAVYSGVAIANFYDGSHNFIAAGGLSLNATFAPGSVSMSATISNLNGNSLTFGGGGSTPGPFSLSLSTASGPAGFDPMSGGSGSGSVRFAGPGTPPENVYGHFAAQDSGGTNRAAGVLMGER